MDVPLTWIARLLAVFVFGSGQRFGGVSAAAAMKGVFCYHYGSCLRTSDVRKVHI